jgi:hypothetical protein
MPRPTGAIYPPDLGTGFVRRRIRVDSCDPQSLLYAQTRGKTFGWRLVTSHVFEIAHFICRNFVWAMSRSVPDRFLQADRSLWAASAYGGEPDSFPVRMLKPCSRLQNAGTASRGNR